MNTIKVVNNKINSDIKLNIKNNNIYLRDVDICIIYQDSNINYNFIISNTVKLFEYFNNSKINSNYTIEENAEFFLNRFSLNCSVSTDIKLKENSKLFYKYSCLNFNDNNYLINIDHDKNTISRITSHGLNLNKSKLDFVVNCLVKRNCFNVDTNQDSKIILMDDNNSSIKPNLLIDNNDIIANHSAYLGHFKDEELFYLQSRGMSLKNSEKLLAKAFLVSKMDIDFSCKNMILQDLNNNWR